MAPARHETIVCAGAGHRCYDPDALLAVGAVRQGASPDRAAGFIPGLQVTAGSPPLKPG